MPGGAFFSKSTAELSLRAWEAHRSDSVQPSASKSHPMKRILTLCFALGLVAAAPVAAQQWGQAFSPSEARTAVKEGRSLPLSQILDKLKTEHGGYLLGAELFSTEAGGTEYHIDWMTEDGRKTVFVVDAQTGNVLRRRGA